MKHGNIIVILVIALALSLGAGCAKKPAPDDTAATPDQQQTQTTTTDQQRSTDRSSMSETEVSESAAEKELSLKRIHFDFDQYTLSAAAREKLENNAEFMRANPEVEVQIQGHCDERGSDSYNLALGEKRARAALDYLVSLGISSDRLSIISYGEERPLVQQSNEDAWAKNRRAEFVLR
ncbi:MAG: peptidoglycan-associated lipoprotein Pal [Desulfuromonadales bacterium]|nr:peptidoglycan-associated lipoprotein Pal [Desulfuromonadales bacterium]NIR32932.1 peptidoglycan-associated lipoprotein Pal [Desulfuromonadales bacterium]NIS39179.1 peptidoglycan-associated lipoprotein Pal [Desulfuromonadales bacterium]